ncbi:SirA-like protein [gamma proteobacterium HdN1]|nr:SirA-like protein [gamma proteobacterium HdN1]
MSETHQYDARGLLCPLPVIRVQSLVKKLPEGDIVEVVGTDPGILHDIPAWCRVHGHTVLSTEQRGKDYYVTLKVGEKS